MTNSFNLSIKSPCSEKWDSFDKNGSVGFCSSCQKNVVDFTTYIDREIIEFFKKNKGNICGRLRDDQLKIYEGEKERNGVNKIAAVIAAGVLSLTQAPEAISQNKDSVELKVSATDTTVKTGVDSKLHLPQITIQAAPYVEHVNVTMGFVGTKEPENNISWPLRLFKKKNENKSSYEIGPAPDRTTRHSRSEFIRPSILRYITNRK